ncbi:hypothetical protein BKA58DRAFT_319335 [Alternaria rosae]|uniref:uncharacterized protein n=1 Tax=Alternaria rosae TaxID=1187941 RepID=UPI001E8DA515|nr:uncharacterized protein BKA58DRAFT_319335 [Alternaria rosae]KAH6866354.1 hypothetical protein BKA58DRAFT_319335 [Alternaria rosae]
MLFGFIIDKRSNKQQHIWVLLYPPTKEGRHAEVQFHSFHPDTGAFVKYDDSNISTTVSALADAFRNPKKAAKGKHVALAKYYYLEALVAREAKTGSAELVIAIPVNRTFIDSMRVVCNEFKEEANERSAHMRSPSATLVEDDDGVLSDFPEDLSEPTQQSVEPSSTITPETSPAPVNELQLQSSMNALESEQTALDIARGEIEGEQQRLEQRRRVNEEKQADINARREQAFNGMSLLDAFKLGVEMEREGKRRKLDIRSLAIMFARSPQPDDSPSYAKLKRDLGDDAPLLNFLPYKRATFEPQNEIAEAAPERLLYGDMMESKGSLWIYWTLNYHNKKKSHHDYRMITFQTIEGAKNHEAGVRPGSVQNVALASWPFKHAKDHDALAAIAKYLFIRKGIDMQLQFPVSSGPFREALMRVCQHYKAIYNETQANKAASRRASVMPTGGHHEMANQQFQDPREPSSAASLAPSQAHSPAPSQSLFQPLFRDPSRPVNNNKPNLEQPAGVVRPGDVDRETMMDQYIALKAREEELDGRISDMETERVRIADQVTGLQADINAIGNRKGDLEEEKGRVRAEKKQLQIQLDKDEHLDFGFEAGRRMETKRQRRE